MAATATSSAAAEPLACRQCGHGFEATANFCAICGAPAQGDAAPDPLVGRVVADRYRIMQLVGRGGMGVVYKCEHTRMGKVMAIKLLHGELARDQEVQRRFRREAQAASKLSHPSTVSIFDFGTSDGLMYLVMEYVPGDDLGKALRTAGQLAPARVAALAAQACGSLGEAHDLGIVHRDLKPENLLITRPREGGELVKLLDFGLAKLREGEDRNEITSAGTLIGTPYYMAPEVIRGQGADHRVDIYALGAVIYRAVVGAPPFTGPSPVAVLTRHLTDDLVPPSRRRPDLAIPPAIDAIVARCMARSADERYQRIEDLREALLEYLASEGVSDADLRVSGLTRRTGAGVGATDRPPRAVTGKHAVATRSDVEAFERELRRGRLALRALLGGAAAAALLVGGLVLHHHLLQRTRPRDTEFEPNQTPQQATLIAPRTSVRGRIGQRLAPDRGDVDVFRLLPVRGGPRRLRVELSGQPTVDLVLELMRAGQPTAVAVADDVGPGGREVIAGFQVDDGEYYLSVHERLRPGMHPVESVSDQYVLSYEFPRFPPGYEAEPNDREEVAGALLAGTEHSGVIESRGDEDYWCLPEQPAALRVVLAPPPELDLELVVRHRDGTHDEVVDAHALGEPESVRLARPAARPPCVIVRASSTRRAEHGEPDRRYTLQALPR